ncbi:hypothetical protein [Pseudonocardia sp. WMMC193]|uniref:hypothetical protein n=1 Tax=Pseudonocardia sp. WMMC193 TaxID=2911965 RepID=UPI001F222E43|nr:hypothetical protein [Pseudonocardia sp. WMMC193]MCF7552209.1 hypothetical protein [Pseudonocardia sp. WMMC193]
MSTAMHDQALAAMDEAERIATTARVAPWNAVIHSILTRWMPASVEGWTACDDLPMPQVCYGLPDLPGHLMCKTCWLAAARNRKACDGCGIVVPAGLASLTVCPIGPALVRVRLCVACSGPLPANTHATH